MFPVFVLIVTLQISPLESIVSTEESVKISIPIFLKDFSNCLLTSSSSTGTIFGKNSTIVTLVPMVA